MKVTDVFSEELCVRSQCCRVRVPHKPHHFLYGPGRRTPAGGSGTLAVRRRRRLGARGRAGGWRERERCAWSAADVIMLMRFLHSVISLWCFLSPVRFSETSVWALRRCEGLDVPWKTGFVLLKLSLMYSEIVCYCNSIYFNIVIFEKMSWLKWFIYYITMC